MGKKPLALRLSTVAVAALAALIGTVALAVDTAAIDQQVSATLNKFYALNERNKYLADNAAGVLVFPKERCWWAGRRSVTTQTPVPRSA